MLQGVKNGGTGTMAAMIIAISALALTSVMVLLCFTSFYSAVFQGSSRSKKAYDAKEAGVPILVSMGMLAFLCLAIGVLPKYAFKIVERAASYFTMGLGAADVYPSLGPILSSLSVVFVFFVGISVFIALLRGVMLFRKKDEKYKTWDCGYTAGNSRMQYTASSFARPFLKLVGPVAGIKDDITKPEGLFPQKASFKSEPEDVFETSIIQPIAVFTKKALALFSWIQSGNMQHYVLYGILFLIASVVWIMSVKL